MIVCFMCNQNISCDFKVLFRHFKLVHHLCETNARYTCCQNQCCRTFGSKYVFKRHIEITHAADICSYSQESAVTDIEENDVSDSVSSGHDVNPGASAPEDIVHEFNVESYEQLAFKFVCQAKRKIATLESVNGMVDACAEMVHTIVSDLHEEFKSLRASPSEAAWERLSNKFKSSLNPFKGLKNQYQQCAYQSKMGVYVPPTEYAISTCQSFVIDRKTQFTKPQMQKITGQHVSIRNMIKMLNEHTDLIKTAVSINKTGTDDILTFFDGIHWNGHPLCNQKVLVLRLYGDDFEPANPLGSHKSVYKLGCIYYQFENLPLHMQSKTDNIFLALCYHSDDIKNFGWSAVFKPLVDELKSLESNGIDLEINGALENYKVVISCITGDNLFLNGVLGFVESFTATHPCRHCTSSRADFKIKHTEQADEIRTVKSYDEAVSKISVSETGIKELCVLNELHYFHASENYVQDLMHDMLEGVCSYDMRLVCNNLSVSTVTIQTLNNRMQSCNFGYHDMSSKPPVITSFDNEMLPFEAAEMWCFMRYLSVVIGDLISCDNEAWLLYLHLRQIMDLVFSPRISKPEIDLLRVLISEYLQMRCKLFPLEPVKNKHHHMVHYPRLIALNGPMSRFWCMRFEQKHQRYKRLAHITGNFKNMPKTVASRHQQDVVSRLVLSSQTDIEIGSGESI
jgi:hypothetical protein